MIEDLQWRYATKKFDTTKQLSEEQLDIVAETLRLSPSSFGLQPWKFFIITDKDLKEKLKKHAYGQPQITDASAVVVLCAKRDIKEEDVEKYMESIAQTRGVEKENLEEFKNMVLGSLEHKSSKEKSEWAQKQTYIALGTLLTTVAQLKIDACPMEGINSEGFDNELKLQEWSTVTVCPIGFRASDDTYAELKKVRFPKEDIITII